MKETNQQHVKCRRCEFPAKLWKGWELCDNCGHRHQVESGNHDAIPVAESMPDKTKTPTPELLPCPFCNGEVRETMTFGMMVHIGDYDCPFGSSVFTIGKWNRRVAPPAAIKESLTVQPEGISGNKMKIQLCTICNIETGNWEDDSLYVDLLSDRIGPLCYSCHTTQLLIVDLENWKSKAAESFGKIMEVLGAGEWARFGDVIAAAQKAVSSVTRLEAEVARLRGALDGFVKELPGLWESAGEICGAICGEGGDHGRHRERCACLTYHLNNLESAKPTVAPQAPASPADTDKWPLNNPKAMASINRGLAEVERGEITPASPSGSYPNISVGDDLSPPGTIRVKPSSHGRSGLKILHLTLHRKWFDEIATGKKKIEYREMKPFWFKRLFDKSNLGTNNMITWDEVHFRNGYSKDAPFMRIKWRGMNCQIWSGGECFAIHLGKILEIKNWAPTPGAETRDTGKDGAG